jgi:hypothetical protein
MSSRRLRCALYATVALLALIGTQTELFRHFHRHGTVATFLTDPVVNPAASFLTIDVVAVAVVALIFMVAESRRLGLPRLWLYVALTFVVAISVALPLFMIERERHLATHPERP